MDDGVCGTKDRFRYEPILIIQLHTNYLIYLCIYIKCNALISHDARERSTTYHEATNDYEERHAMLLEKKVKMHVYLSCVSALSPLLNLTYALCAFDNQLWVVRKEIQQQQQPTSTGEVEQWNKTRRK